MSLVDNRGSKIPPTNSKFSMEPTKKNSTPKLAQSNVSAMQVQQQGRSQTQIHPGQSFIAPQEGTMQQHGAQPQGRDPQQPGAGYFQQPASADPTAQGIRAAPGVLKRAVITPGTEPPPPPDNFVFTICTAVCCFCSPLGCLAIKKSKECRAALLRGDKSEAERLARDTKTMASAAFGLGVACAMLVILIVAAIQMFPETSFSMGKTGP